MKIVHILLAVLCLACAGCSSHSDEAYRRLLELAGIKDMSRVHRLEFVKTSGIDPYYLAKVEVDLRSVSEIPSLLGPTTVLKTLDARYVTPPQVLEWWRPQDLADVKIWTPKERDVPSYTEIVGGLSGSKVVVYVAWMTHQSF
jgi:hypothetical protein